MAIQDIINGMGPVGGGYTPPVDPNSLLQALSATSRQPAPAPPPRQKLKAALSDFTSTLMFTLGESLRAGASAPGRRGTQAAAGAAFQAPMMLQQIRAAEAQKRQQEELAAQERQRKIEQEGFENYVRAQQLKLGQRAEDRLGAPKPPEAPPDYTLGNSRFSGQTNQPIAVNEPTPKVETKVIGKNLVNSETGKVIATFNDDDDKPDTRTLEKAHVDDRIAEAEDKKGSTLSTAERIAVRSRAVSEYDRLKTDPSLMAQRLSSLETAKMIREDGMRDDFEKRTAEAFTRKNSYDYIQSVRNSPAGGADDVVLIYNFVKMQDPNAVKEGEIDLVRQTGGLVDNWKRYLQGITTGAQLGPEAKKKLINAADTLYKDVIAPNIKNATTEFTDRAKSRNLDPAQIVRPIAVPPESTGWKIISTK